MIRPPKLEPGQTIGLICPASPPKDPALLEQAEEILHRFGFKVKLGAHVRKRAGFLAGTDRERVSDIHQLFRDKTVSALLCVRGGYGTARLLPLLDYDLVSKNAKPLIGFSDITALQIGILKKAGLITFQGPMLSSHLSKPDLAAFTLQSFSRTVMKTAVPGSITDGFDRASIRILRKGVAEGRLIGGNLAVLCTLVGTPWWIPLRGKILFLEEVDEAPYRIDRMLTFLLQTRALDGVKGIALGQCARCSDRNYPDGPTDLEVFEERLRPLGVPIVAQLPFGHVPHNATLPVGARAQLDANRGDLLILEPVVTG